jgi:hypothetical protein
VKTVTTRDTLIKFRVGLLFALETNSGLGYASPDTCEAKDRNI